MKNVLKIALLVVFLHASAYAQTFQMQSVSDAPLRTNQVCTDWQTTNLGSSVSTTVAHWTWYGPGCGEGVIRGLWRFDLNPATDHTMLYDNRAFLHMFFPTGSSEVHQYTGSATNNQFYVQRVTQNWNESTVTWNTAPTVTTAGQILVPSCTPNPSTADYIINISGLAYEWICNSQPNNGVMLRMVTENELYRRVSFTNREWSVAARRPYMRLEYAKITASAPDTVCSGQAFTINCSLTNANTPSQYSYIWTHLNSGTTYSTQNVNTPQNIAGMNTYVVHASNPWCQTATDTVRVFISTGSASLSASPTTICQGQSTTLTASGSSAYSWSHGLGTGSSKVVTPSTSTTYTVTGTNAQGCTGTSSITINVNANPAVTISPSSPSICAGSSTTITGSGATTYNWSNSLGTNASQNVSPGTTTTYTVTGTTSGCTGTANVTVTVNSNPTITISPSSPSICAGSSTTISASGATSYNWSNSLGTNASQNVSPSSTTTYTVTGTTGSCTGTASVTVTVNSNPVVSITPTTSDICQGDNVVVSASGATSYNWSHSLGTSSSQTLSPSSTTTYTVTGTTGACTGSASTTVTVHSVPAVTITPSSSTICSGESILLTAGGADTYDWGLLTGPSQTVSPTTTTTYTVTGTSGICSGSASATVTVTSSLSAVISSAGPFCANDNSVQLVAADGGGVWSGSGITNPTSGMFDPTTAGAGTHTITYAITGACGDTATTEILVYDIPIITPTYSNESCTGASDGQISLSVSGGNPPYSYTWQPTGSGNASIDLPHGTYSIFVTDANGCSTVSDITLNDPLIPCEVIIPHIFIPNVFSPNGDGQNDVLYVRGDGIEFFEFLVFNRWGQKVFETTNQLLGWNGTFHGKPLEPGVYVYMLKATMINGETIQKSGDITIVW
jgi:gliding motility-associated-like protein